MTKLGTTPRRCTRSSSAVGEQRAAIAKSKPADEYKLILCYLPRQPGRAVHRPGASRTRDFPIMRRRLKIRRELSRTHPENREYTVDLVKALVALGNIQRHLGDADAARQLFADARKALEERAQVGAGRSRTPGSACRRACQRGRRAGRRGAARKGQAAACRRGRPVSQGRGPRGTSRRAGDANGSGAAKRSGTLLVSCASSSWPQEAEQRRCRTN